MRGSGLLAYARDCHFAPRFAAAVFRGAAGGRRTRNIFTISEHGECRRPKGKSAGKTPDPVRRCTPGRSAGAGGRRGKKRTWQEKSGLERERK